MKNHASVRALVCALSFAVSVVGCPGGVFAAERTVPMLSGEFLMGGDLLVAPVVEKGATSRKVLIPPGRWRADDGTEAEGPAEITVNAPLSRLPHFKRIIKGE